MRGGDGWANEVDKAIHMLRSNENVHTEAINKAVSRIETLEGQIARLLAAPVALQKPELLPCPFVHAEDAVDMMVTVRGHEDLFYVKCTVCGTTGRAFELRSNAVDYWNRRNGGGR